MRNHRLFGVVIAVLLGTSFLHQRPSSPHHHHHHRQVAGTHVSGTGGIQLASAALPVDPTHTSLAVFGESPVGLLRPAGAEFGRTRAQLASAATIHQPQTAPASAEGSDIGLLRPAGTRYVTMLYAWMAYQSAHTPPPQPTPTPPGPTPKAPIATVHAVPVHNVPVVAPHPVTTPVAPATQPASGAPIGGVWAELRQCESGGNYSDNTGNGYYGAYQFILSTWRGLGFPGLPSNATPAVQDQAAQKLQARSGWGQWPACSRRLRLI